MTNGVTSVVTTPAQTIVTVIPQPPTTVLDTLRGPQGIPGIAGTQGPPGPQGEPGEPGPAGGTSDHGALTGLLDGDHPQYMVKDENSGPSILSGGVISAGAGGTVNVSAGAGFLRTANDPNAPVVDVTWSEVLAQPIGDNVLTYVLIDYNAGTPIVLLTTTLGNRYDRSLLGGVARSGTNVWVTQGTVPAGNVSRLVSRYLFLARGVDHVQGLATSETGARNLVNTAGTVFSGLNEYALSARNTASGDTFETYHRNGAGGWTAVPAQTQWNNTQYDNGTGALATLSSNRYGVHWVFRDVDSNLILLYGQGDYTLAQAQAIGLPASLPANLQYWHSVFVAKIIFQRGAAVATQIDNPFTTYIGAGAASDHGALAGLADDDHPQYLTQARGDVLYAPIGSGGGGGVPGGANTNIQYNNAGAFAGSADLTWDNATKTMRLATVASTITLTPAVSGSAGALNIKGGTAAGTGTGGPAILRGGDPINGTGGYAQLVAADGVGAGNGGGDALIYAGDGLTSGIGGAVTINGGDSGTGAAGWITLAAGKSSSTANSGSFRVRTFDVTRLQISGAGVWEVGGSPGTSGQVLTSQGSASPPIWAAGTAAAAGSNGQIQYNAAGVFAADVDLSYDATNNTLTIGGASVAGVIRGAQSSNTPNITIQSGTLTTGAGGTANFMGANATVANQGGGHAILSGGNVLSGAFAGGNATIQGGLASSGTGGAIYLKTGNAALTERLRIDATGQWLLAGGAGSAGQALCSNGASAAPTWQAPALRGDRWDNAALNRVISFNTAGGGINYGSAFISGASNGYHGLAIVDGGANPIFMSNGTSCGIHLQLDAKWLIYRTAAAVAQSDYTVNAPAFNVMSSRALKRETGKPSQLRELLSKLRPIFYRLLADDSQEQIGMIAEEVHAVCPQLSDGATISYDRLAVLLLAEWQERYTEDPHDG